jgi:hypothetical protein
MSGKNLTTGFVAVAGVVATLALSACGGSAPVPSPEDAVKATVDAYNEGILSGDGPQVCSTLTTKGRQEMTDRSHGASCARAAADVHKSFLGPPSKFAVTVTQVWVHGDHARAHAVSTEPHQHGEVQYTLVKSGGAWKIDFVLGSS